MSFRHAGSFHPVALSSSKDSAFSLQVGKTSRTWSSKGGFYGLGLAVAHITSVHIPWTTASTHEGGWETWLAVCAQLPFPKTSQVPPLLSISRAPGPGSPQHPFGLQESRNWSPLLATIPFPHDRQNALLKKCQSDHWCVCFPAYSLSNCSGEETHMQASKTLRSPLSSFCSLLFYLPLPCSTPILLAPALLPKALAASMLPPSHFPKKPSPTILAGRPHFPPETVSLLSHTSLNYFFVWFLANPPF